MQATSDGQPVLFHDEALARTADVAVRFPGRENDLVGTDEVSLLAISTTP